MANVNKVTLIGNLTRDPDLRYTTNGTAVCDLALATNRFRKGENGEKIEEVTYVEVKLWARQAEIAGEFLSKGKPVYIDGRLKLETWDDKETGKKRSKMVVIGESLQLLGMKSEGERQGTKRLSSPPKNMSIPSNRKEEVTGDEIPF